jgi:YbgC/YbaW family acyl-CoA thioester hydrolase
MPVVFRTKRRVEFVDTDMAGIVHFSNFFRWMEAAEVAYLRERGLSVAMEWEGKSIGFPRVSATCDFLRPVRFEDIVEILVEAPKVGRSSVRYAFEFRHGGQTVARGQTTCVCCRMRAAPHALEAYEIPAGLRARLLADGPAGESDEETELL